MTGPVNGGETPDNSKRHELLNTLIDAVVNNDSGFITDVASNQQILEPSFVAEFMDAKRKRSQDDAEKAQWGGALTTYLATLKDKELPDDQQEVINGIVRDMEFDAITGNTEMAEEPDAPKMPPRRPRGLSWEREEGAVDTRYKETEFWVPLQQEEIDAIRATSIFKLAEEYATGRRDSPYSDVTDMAMAVRTLNKNLTGDALAKARTVMDWYVYDRAEAYASGRLPSPYSDRTDMDMAKRTVERFASTGEVALFMKQALDKHVYARAEAYALGRLPSPYSNRTDIEMAKRTVEKFASSREVLRLMKEELDEHFFARAKAYATGQEPPPYSNFTPRKMAIWTVRQFASSPEVREEMLRALGLAGE